MRPPDPNVKKRGRPKKAKQIPQQQIDSVSNFTFNNGKVPEHPPELQRLSSAYELIN